MLWERVASARPSSPPAGGTRSSSSTRRSAPLPRIASLSIPAHLSPHRWCTVDQTVPAQSPLCFVLSSWPKPNVLAHFLHFASEKIHITFLNFCENLLFLPALENRVNHLLEFLKPLVISGFQRWFCLFLFSIYFG